MKKILFILFVFVLPQIVIANKFYVHPNGNDGNPGTIGFPFKTWDRLNGFLVAGDTAFIRGGTYLAPKGNAASVQVYWQNLHGNANNWITIMAYPGEQPVLDGSNITPTYPDPNMVYIINCSYVHFIGLHVTNLKQISDGSGISRGWNLDNSPNIWSDRIEVDHVGGGGVNIYSNCDDAYFLNCDSHHNADPFSGGGPGAYGNADGFDCTGGVNTTRITFEGCRAYFNSDDGWDNFNTTGTRIWKNCLAYRNGYVQDINGNITNGQDGNGFKLGPLTNGACGTDNFSVLRVLQNCVAFNNRANGFDQNGQPTMLYQIYNCTAYKNGTIGFQFQYSCATPNNLPQTLKNNVSYLNGTAVNFTGPQTNVSNNTWNGAVTVNSADFLSLDSTGISGPRDNVTGAYPNLNFLKLAPGSDLINAGVNVGLPYVGSAPDMGAYEFISGTNIPPVANAGSDQTITLPINSVTLTGNGTDADGSIASWSWTKISGPAATISNPNVQTTSATGLVQGVYQFQLQVTDNAGATNTDIVQVTVNPAPLTAPTCTGTGSVSITLPTNSAALVMTATSTTGGSISSYGWIKTSGPATGTIQNAALASTNAINLVQGTYVFTGTATDNNNLTCTTVKTIAVNPAPIVPTANAGGDQTITLPTNSSSLSGSGTGGTINSYQWTIVGGLGGVLSNPTATTTNLTGLSQGVYKIELRVGNTVGNFGYDTVQITVNPAPVLPTANAGTDKTITLPTNTAAMNGSGTGVGISYLWTKLPSSPATGTIQNTTSAITAGQNLVQGVYSMELKVTDANSNIAKDTMIITVNAAPNVNPTANAGSDQVIQLPTNTVNLSGSGTDPDGTISGYLWTKVSGPAGNIATATNASTSAFNLVQGVYKFELQVTDNNGGTGKDTMQVTVVAAANIPPVANAGPDQTITLPVSIVTLSGSGTDADGSIVSYGWQKTSGPATGSLTSTTSQTTSAINLVQGTYQFTLTVTDNNGAIATDVIQITVNAAIVVPPTANAGIDKVITLPVNTAALNGSGTGTGISYQWTKLASSPSGGSITNNALAITDVSGLIQGVYKYELKVTDNISQVARDTMQITVNNPITIVPPVVNAGKDQIVYLPNTSTSVTGTVVVSNGTLDSLSWSQVSGNTATIVSSGSLTTSITGLAQGVYKFQLYARDSNGFYTYDTIQITVQLNIYILGIYGLQAYLYPDNSGRGDIGWTFDYSKYPATLYMVGQMKVNGVYQDFGGRKLPSLRTKDYWSFFDIRKMPKGEYFFRVAQVFPNNIILYTNPKSVVKKK